jgi:hypothetical protein
MQDIKISIYRSAKDNEGENEPYSIKQTVEAIKSDTYKTVTEEYRRILASVDKKTPEGKKAIRNFKEFNFKGVIWSGFFSYRSTAGLSKHSGLICLDIDGRDSKGEIINGLATEEDLNRLRFKLISDEYSFIVFISPSGIGLKVICKIGEPGEEISAEDHKEKYFPKLEEYFLNKYDKKIDSSGKNVDRLCFLPCDPNIYVNYESDNFTLHSIMATQGEGGGAYRDTVEQIQYCIGELKSRGIDITTDYDKWRNIGFAFASLGEEARGMFHEVSALYSGYDREETDYKFSNFIQTGSGKIGIQTFFYHCKEVGINLSQAPANSPEAIKRKENFKELYAAAHAMNREGRRYNEADISFWEKNLLMHPDKVRKAFDKVFDENKDEWKLNEKPDIYRVEVFLKKNYDLYRNEITTRVEGKLTGSADDHGKLNADSIFRHLQHEGFKYPMDKLKSLLKSDFVPLKNPFKEYFFSLPEWDSVDYIGQLAGYVKTDDDKFWADMFKKALVRSIACAIGGRENRIVMVLVQEDQSTGKSNFIRFLNPFKDKYYTESPLRDGKDTEFRFSENFIYNLEELSALGALDINKLKAIISKSTVKERRAYAEFEEELPRRCNFWGSTNKAEFLTDTQNTRWLCFRVVSIDFGYNNMNTGEAAININDVWGQAYALYKSGFDYNLTKEEASYRDMLNKAYEQGSNEKDLIIQTYIPCERGAGKFVPVANIEIELTTKFESKVRNMNRAALGRALTQLGFIGDSKKLNGHTARGYWLKEITPLTVVTNAPAPSNNVQGEIFKPDGSDDDLPF